MNGGQVVQHPGLAHRERTIVVLSSLVHPYTTRLADSDDNDTRFLICMRRLEWWRTRWVCRIFEDPDVCNIRFRHC